MTRIGPGPAPVIRKIKERHAQLNGKQYDATADDDDDDCIPSIFLPDKVIYGKVYPWEESAVANGIAFPSGTPESERATNEAIVQSANGAIVEACFRRQCLGYVVKVVTAEHDPKGWYLECTRKNDRIRPCNYKRDAYGNETAPLPPVKRNPPPSLVVPPTVEAGKGPAPSTPAGKGGAAVPASNPGVSQFNKTPAAAPFPTPPGTSQFNKNPPAATVSTQGGQGQNQKTFGTTQRVLFPNATGKHPLDDTLGAVDTPAAKRQCTSAITAKDEFDDLDDYDMGFWDAATTLAQKAEATLGPAPVPPTPTPQPRQNRQIAPPRQNWPVHQIAESRRIRPAQQSAQPRWSQPAPQNAQNRPTLRQAQLPYQPSPLGPEQVRVVPRGAQWPLQYAQASPAPATVVRPAAGPGRSHTEPIVLD